ncbi:MAG: ABC transporter substrate-binding protein [Polyangiales bacterium]
MRHLLYATLLLAGCSAIVDDNTQQCTQASDCASLGAGMTCSDNVCTMPLGEIPAAECTTNDECTSKRGAGFTCNTTSQMCVKSGCAKNSECTNTLGKAGLCRPDGMCQPLFTKECTDVYPNDAELSDDMFLVGFMGAIRGNGKDYGEAQLKGEQLALDEIQNNLGGLPGVGAGAKRNLAILVCDHGADDADPNAIGEHLVNELQLPAILGASFSGVTIGAYRKAVARNVLVFSPAATSPEITELDAPNTDLMWRTVPSDVVQGGALKLVVALVTKTLRDKGVLTANQAPVVAMPWKDDPAGFGLYTATFNGVNAVNGDPSKYAPMALSDPAQAALLAKKIVDAAPHIVLHLGTSEFVQYVMPLIEQSWTAAHRPWYVVPEGDLEELKQTKASFDMITKYELTTRMIGTTPGGRRTDQYRQFRGSFGAEPGNLAEFAYDAVYLLAYAIAAADKQVPTGAELATGLRKMSCKTGLKVQPGAGFTAAWNAARMGCIDYSGPSGELDFDKFGESETDVSVGCFRKAGDKHEYVRLDTYYSIGSKTLATYKSLPLDLNSPGWCTPFTP